MKMTWQRLAEQSSVLASKLPPNVCGILGLARKGMVPATIIAEQLHLPLGEVGMYANGGGFFVGGGRRGPLYTEGDTIVIIDDGTSPSAQSLNAAAKLLRQRFPGQKFATAAVWVPAGWTAGVDFWCEQFDGPETFFQQSEFPNTPEAHETLYDFDGMLCVDPPKGETDDVDYWTAVFDQCQPLYLPRRFKALGIVSARLEKYRPVCEAWLARWGVVYESLILNPSADCNARGDGVAIASWKAGIFANTERAKTFVESDAWQAGEIRRISGKPVFCIETWEHLG